MQFFYLFMIRKMTLPTNNHKNMFTSSDSKTGRMIEEFCELTSLHGFSFLYKANTIAVKMIWILAIFSVTAVGIFFLIGNTEAYMHSRLATNIESSTANLSVSTNQIQ